MEYCLKNTAQPPKVIKNKLHFLIGDLWKTQKQIQLITQKSPKPVQPQSLLPQSYGRATRSIPQLKRKKKSQYPDYMTYFLSLPTTLSIYSYFILQFFWCSRFYCRQEYFMVSVMVINPGPITPLLKHLSYSTLSLTTQAYFIPILSLMWENLNDHYLSSLVILKL